MYRVHYMAIFLIEQLEDYRLILEAQERYTHANAEQTISHDDLLKELEVSSDDLEKYHDVEIQTKNEKNIA